MENPCFQGEKISLQMSRINSQPPGVQGLNSSTNNNQVLEALHKFRQIPTVGKAGNTPFQSIFIYLSNTIGLNVLVGENQSIILYKSMNELLDDARILKKQTRFGCT